MPKISSYMEINHVTLIVNQLEEAAKWYEDVVGLEPVPAFVFDYPTAFFKFPNGQQLHLSEWDDEQSFRGHLCLTIDNWSEMFHRVKALSIIDLAPWGNVRQLQKGVMQMFVRDPSGNLVEFVSRPEDADAIDPAIFEDDLYKEGLYISGRNDFRGYKAENATLYTGK